MKNNQITLETKKPSQFQKWIYWIQGNDKTKKQNLNELKQLKLNESTPTQEIGNHSLHFILYHGFLKQIMIFRVFLVYFTFYLLHGAFVGLESAFWPHFLGAATMDFFCTILLFMSSTCGFFCKLFLFLSSTSGFFNICWIMFSTLIIASKHS